ncbi:hypothetical protein [Paenibacillus turpanensis]|uniref:hypothetical protein n=1 Tax=Paenibacillus turpanensis TaxID=2689078 RepID=UPI0014099D13|nr:hypothetical protein [Paenibacillus turpanensis]
MNIQQLLRSFVGDVAPAEPKLLELKVGQVIKGLVLQLLENQEAIVNLGGTHVKARLETPLAPGQVTLLQVQPESAQGQVVLKPLQKSALPINPEAAGDALKVLGLKDQPELRRLVQHVQAAGMAVTRETIDTLRTGLGEQALRSADADELAQAGILAVKRGLPLSEDVVKSLRQTLFGPPLDSLLDKLSGELKDLARSASERGNAQTAQLAGKLEAVLSKISAAGAAVLGVMEPGKEGAEGQKPAAGERIGAGAPGGNAAAASVPPRAPLPSAAAVPIQGGLQGGGSTAGGRELPPQVQGLEVQTGAAVKPNAVAAILKSLGIDHESDLLKMLERNEADRSGIAAQKAAGNEIQASAGEGAPARSAAPQETIKQLLLSLLQSEDVPASVKDTAGQLTQQISGQQLLMTPDRSGMLSHMTVFVPLLGPDGRQTAAVHIQSRKGAKGGVDADNCRLLFDLQMKTLGDTIVDVQVVDKIVSLQVHNNFPHIAPLLEQTKPEIQQALHSVGYQLLSLKAAPIPEQDAASGASGSAAGAAAAAASKYASKPYKGVDLRV